MQKIYFALASLLLITSCASPLAVSDKASHPLDPLDAKEVAIALSTLRKEGRVGESTLFPYLMLKEPAKQSVLAWREGQPFAREAFAMLYDRATGKLAEATVDLHLGKVTEHREVPGMQPSVMLSEFESVPPIVKADPRFKVAMKRRGIENLDEVAVDTWSYGSPDSEVSRKKRLMRAIAYYKGKGTNFYARPIDGFTAVVDMVGRKVIEVVDTDTRPLPPEAADFDKASIEKLSGGKLRAPLKPLVISQPEGPSFTVRGNEVRWNKWSFRFALHPREGLVLYLVRYDDNGTWRTVLYRASLSEMMVPYGHSDQHWTYRAAFDEGEYGIGRYSGSLDVGADVPSNARLFDALFVNDFGKPYVTKDAVALWERDGGLLWKHMDMYNAGRNESRRSRELVVGFITTISNYDYGLNWVFKEDGSIELETVLSGIMLAKGTTVAKLSGHGHGHGANADMRFGHLVAPYVAAPHHQHFFSMRLDLDVDGVKNSVAELESRPLPEGKENPLGNAFEMVEKPIGSEAEGARDLDFASQRKWLVYNPASRTPGLGYPRGFLLKPGENARPYLQPSSPLLKRGGFVKHQVWFTQHHDDELYAAGPYPLQRETEDGLPVWIKKDRSLANEDAVLWYTFCVTHAPRPEEWPVMSTHKTGFHLMPAGFFDRNPALDVRR